MRQNLLQIYQKFGKSFDVGDIAARFSYVSHIQATEIDEKFAINSLNLIFSARPGIRGPIVMKVTHGFRSVTRTRRYFR